MRRTGCFHLRSASGMLRSMRVPAISVLGPACSYNHLESVLCSLVTTAFCMWQTRLCYTALHIQIQQLGLLCTHTVSCSAVHCMLHTDRSVAW